MITFFTILFILIGINALMMVFSFASIGKGGKSLKSSSKNSIASEIYPIDLASSEYKKAV